MSPQRSWREHRLLPPPGETYTAIDADANGHFAITILAPEPSSLSLLAFATLPLLRRRRT